MGLLPDDITDLSEALESDSNGKRLGIGDYAVVEPGETITCHGLGSCIAIILYDPVSGVGGGIHALLPKKSEFHSEDDKRETRFVDVGLKTLYEEVVTHPNVEESRLIAKITGGSDVLRLVSFATDIGQKNTAAARQCLDELGVDLTAEDVGGNSGRIIEFVPSTGGVIIRKANGEQTVI